MSYEKAMKNIGCSRNMFMGFNAADPLTEKQSKALDALKKTLNWFNYAWQWRHEKTWYSPRGLLDNKECLCEAINKIRKLRKILPKKIRQCGGGTFL